MHKLLQYINSELMKTISVAMACALVVAYSSTAYADDSIISNISETSLEKVVSNGLPDLSVQINDLYNEIGKEVGVDYKYVKMIHLLSGGDAVYADKRPNIYADKTVNIAFYISNERQDGNRMHTAPWVYCPDESIVRPSYNYLPDAAYTTTKNITDIMNKRITVDRGSLQPYFDGLDVTARTNMLFYEAVLEYLGEDLETVNNFQTIYSKALNMGVQDGGLLEYSNNRLRLKGKYRDIFEDNGIHNVDKLEIMLSLDNNIGKYRDNGILKYTNVTPYKVGYSSRENALTAAMSVVGKVRYVWGGGHLGTASIQGINPIWKKFNDIYNFSDDTDMKDGCIKPSESFCPLHGYNNDENGCLSDCNIVYSVDQYTDERKRLGIELNENDIHMLNGIKYIQDGMVSHRLDGLDCSGYTNWVFNQIDNTINYDFGAAKFIELGRFSTVEYTDLLLPCDIVSWGEHIVIVVGKLDNGGSGYVMLEASPNIVKFGGLVYNRTSNSDRDRLEQVCDEANRLLGNIDSNENINIYNLDTIGYKEDEERFMCVGRYSGVFEDDSNLSERVKDMCAIDIIQKVLEKYTDDFVSGIGKYQGKIFNIDSIKILH